MYFSLTALLSTFPASAKHFYLMFFVGSFNLYRRKQLTVVNIFALFLSPNQSYWWVLRDGKYKQTMTQIIV